MSARVAGVYNKALPRGGFAQQFGRGQRKTDRKKRTTRCSSQRLRPVGTRRFCKSHQHTGGSMAEWKGKAARKGAIFEQERSDRRTSRPGDVRCLAQPKPCDLVFGLCCWSSAGVLLQLVLDARQHAIHADVAHKSSAVRIASQ